MAERTSVNNHPQPIVKSFPWEETFLF